jgi:hypothetical protein
MRPSRDLCARWRALIHLRVRPYPHLAAARHARLPSVRASAQRARLPSVRVCPACARRVAPRGTGAASPSPRRGATVRYVGKSSATPVIRNCCRRLRISISAVMPRYAEPKMQQQVSRYACCDVLCRFFAPLWALVWFRDRLRPAACFAPDADEAFGAGVTRWPVGRRADGGPLHPLGVPCTLYGSLAPLPAGQTGTNAAVTHG